MELMKSPIQGTDPEPCTSETLTGGLSVEVSDITVNALARLKVAPALTRVVLRRLIASATEWQPTHASLGASLNSAPSEIPTS